MTNIDNDPKLHDKYVQEQLEKLTQCYKDHKFEGKSALAHSVIRVLVEDWV